MPIEGAEHGEAAPGKALVSVEKGVIPRDAHRKHGCLIEELGVECRVRQTMRGVRDGRNREG